MGRGDQDAQIPQIVSGRAGNDGVVQSFEKCMCVAALKRFAKVEAHSMRAGQCFAVRNRAGSGAISIDAVRSRAKNSDVSARDFLDTRKHEGGISAANSVASDW